MVDLSNLQRQVIHSSKDLGKKKVISAKEKIAALDENINITAHEIKADKENLSKLV